MRLLVRLWLLQAYRLPTFGVFEFVVQKDQI